ncbi:MAG: hypothetical protein HUK11_02510 [Muribaculaceae bacterium]|nr:hypothetical protein [Muribaculaceae bacterium]
MKRLSVLFIAALLALASPISLRADEVALATFSLKNFEGWVYSRTGYTTLTANDISSNRVRLFTSESGEIFALSSPVFTCVDMDSLNVTVTYRNPTNGINYNASKLDLTLSLLNNDGEEIAANVITVPKTGFVSQEFKVKFDVTGNNIKLRLHADKADVSNNAAVYSVKVLGYTATHVRGDVNGDGVVDITDVNLIINKILNGGDLPAADINNDGSVDITDANAAINIILTT